jgi:hypothetical protein
MMSEKIDPPDWSLTQGTKVTMPHGAAINKGVDRWYADRHSLALPVISALTAGRQPDTLYLLTPGHEPTWSREAAMDGAYVFCVGMYRSCSTWQYAVACHLLEAHRGGRRLGFIAGEHFAGRGPAEGWQVLKSHEGHPSFAEALRAGRARAFYSFRDLRDVAFSLAHKRGTTFEEVVEEQGMLRTCLANDAFWTSQPHTLTQRYEEIVENPVGAVCQLAAHLDLDLAEGEAAATAERYSLASNRRRAVELAGRLRREGVNLADPQNALLHDTETLLHWNHIREGRRGGWRNEATPRQLAVLVSLCTDWLIGRGYAWDESWWTQADGPAPWSSAEMRRRLDASQGELNRTLPRLKEAEAELTRTRETLLAMRGDLQATRERLADTEGRLREALTALDESQRARLWLEQLGPFALGLARRLHDMAVRHPFLAAAANLVLRRRRSTD